MTAKYMKTSELLDKYRKVLSSILKCKEDEIRFFVGEVPYGTSTLAATLQHGKDRPGAVKEIAELEYFKPKYENGQETGGQVRYTQWNNWSEGKYLVFVKNSLLTTFELYKMPHCCAILVSCKAFVTEKFRNKRIGTIMNSFRQDIGRVLGYSLLFCTDIEQNECQRKLLKTNGWKDVHSVVNKRTNNRVYLSVINI